MKISKEARKQAKSLFLRSFTGGKLDEAKIRAVASALVEKKPRNYFEILKQLHRLTRFEVEKRHALIESAVALSAQAREGVMASLRSKYGPDLTADVVVNPQLLGGLRIRIGSDVWDGSVRGRLARLESNLAAA